VVAERVAEGAVDAVRLLHRLLGELDAEVLEPLVCTAAVVGGEDGRAERALGEQVADLGGDLVAVGGRARHFEVEVAVGRVREGDGEPAHEAEIGVGGDLEAELADVEIDRLFKVEDEHGVNADAVEHDLSLWGREGPALIQTCSVKNAQSATGPVPAVFSRDCSVGSSSSRSTPGP
jgi:hypothetical protein